MPVVRMCDYHLDKLEHSKGTRPPCTILCFPADRVVRWPEQRLPMVIVMPSLLPPFFQIVEGRL